MGTPHLLVALKVAAGKIIFAYTVIVLGVEVADVLGLLSSHNFASACGALAAVAAVALNFWNGRKDRRVRDLTALAVSNHVLLDGQQAAIQHGQMAMLAVEAEVAMIAAEVLRGRNFLAVHSGAGESLRPAVPPVAADVLLVDDDAWVVRCLTRLLERHGFRVESARTAEGAVALVSERDRRPRRYDFAILDLVLPDAPLDAVLDLACEIYQGTDVIITTGIAEEHVLDRAKECAKKVLVKPIDMDELLTLLGCPAGPRP